MKVKTDTRGYGSRNRKCAYCQGVYRAFVSQERHRGSRFCSKACQLAANAPKPKTCRQCRGSFVPKNPGNRPGRYCSRECLYAYNAAHNSQVTRKCAWCEEEFTRPRAWFGAKYCSRYCADTARQRPGREAWRGPLWHKRAAGIRDRDHHLCVRCGASEGARKHHVDHVVPWVLVKQRPEVANDPGNLATLCHSCHGKKTTKVEPRLLKGDIMALVRFYGKPRTDVALRLWWLADHPDEAAAPGVQVYEAARHINLNGRWNG